MHVAIFETTSKGQTEALQTLCAREGKEISIEKIYTAACGSGTGGYYHYVTVTYFTLTPEGAKVL
jgi:hypothetical protein